MLWISETKLLSRQRATATTTTKVRASDRLIDKVKNIVRRNHHKGGRWRRKREMHVTKSNTGAIHWFDGGVDVEPIHDLTRT